MRAKKNPGKPRDFKTTAAKKPDDTLKLLRVAIVHDWLVGGGAEHVVEELHRMFPGAPIYTSYATKEWQRRLHGMVRTGVLQHWPFSRMRKFLPVLRIWWFSRLKLDGFDLVISSSGAEAKGIKVPPGTLHVNYCHAPTHYYWNRYDEYMKAPGFGALNWLARTGLFLLVRPLRKWDYQAAQNPDYIIANSKHIQSEIKKYYDRDSEVIYPPINVDQFKPHDYAERFSFVITGRMTPYKRIDLAVAACSELKLPLKVIGKGPEYDKLTAMAGPSIRFMGYLSEKELIRHMQGARGFLFPGMDDFGIAAVEALAAGTPVIAYGAGGALEYVEDGVSGVFFEEQTVPSLKDALVKFESLRFNHDKIARSAQKFAARNFTIKTEQSLIKLIKSSSKHSD